jgi:large subunit ribosomal protein L4
VKGGNKKPWRQKGTGRARQGSIRAPQWRGGGNVFGPRANRNFKQDVPKQVKWLARRSAYNVRAQDGGVFLIDALQFDAPKTKQVLAVLLRRRGAEGGRQRAGADGRLQAARAPLGRNIPGVLVRPFGQESAYDLLWADTLIIEAPALERAQEVAHA